ncbi:MAG TPA: hypothetical protein QGF58_06735 [Myxococcota bacterium]|nr:hypothetical protein [Myxococcota bacterium]
MLILLIVSDVVLASLVFVSLAKPDLAISFAIRRMGMNDPWFQEHVGEQELDRLRKVARLFGLAGLLAVFGWSFLVGALMAVDALG